LAPCGPPHPATSAPAINAANAAARYLRVSDSLGNAREDLEAMTNL
jgi:hypothetical protein